MKKSNIKITLIHALLLGASAFMITGCENKPKLSELFKSELTQYLKDASKLSTQAGEGLSVVELKEQLTEVKSSFDLLGATWTDNFCQSGKAAFEKSHEAYELAFDLFRNKTLELDKPMEPGTNGWSKYQASSFADIIIIETYPYDCLVESYRGKKYVSYDNIGILLTLASSSFDEGRTAVLKEME